MTDWRRVTVEIHHNLMDELSVWLSVAPNTHFWVRSIIQPWCCSIKAEEARTRPPPHQSDWVTSGEGLRSRSECDARPLVDDRPNELTAETSGSLRCIYSIRTMQAACTHFEQSVCLLSFTEWIYKKTFYGDGLRETTLFAYCVRSTRY